MVAFRINQDGQPEGDPDVSRHDLYANAAIWLVAVNPAPQAGVTYEWEVLDQVGSGASLAASTGSEVMLSASSAVPFAFLIEMRVYQSGSLVGTARRIASSRTPRRRLRLPLLGETAGAGARRSDMKPSESTDNAYYSPLAGIGGAAGRNWRGWAQLLYDLTLAVEDSISSAQLFREYTPSPNGMLGGGNWYQATTAAPAEHSHSNALTLYWIGVLGGQDAQGLPLPAYSATYEFASQENYLTYKATAEGPDQLQLMSPTAFATAGFYIFAATHSSTLRLPVIDWQARWRDFLGSDAPKGYHFEGLQYGTGPVSIVAGSPQVQLLTASGTQTTGPGSMFRLTFIRESSSLQVWHLQIWNPGEAGAPAVPGGDLSGALESVAVVGLRGRPVAEQAPGDAQVLAWDEAAGHWAPSAMGAGDATALMGRSLEDAAPLDGQVLTWSELDQVWRPMSGGAAGDATALRGVSISTDAPGEGTYLLYGDGLWRPAPLLIQGAVIDAVGPLPEPGQILAYFPPEGDQPPRWAPVPPPSAAAGLGGAPLPESSPAHNDILIFSEDFGEPAWKYRPPPVPRWLIQYTATFGDQPVLAPISNGTLDMLWGSQPWQVGGNGTAGNAYGVGLQLTPSAGLSSRWDAGEASGVFVQSRFHQLEPTDSYRLFVQITGKENDDEWLEGEFAGVHVGWMPATGPTPGYLGSQAILQFGREPGGPVGLRLIAGNYGAFITELPWLTNPNRPGGMSFALVLHGAQVFAYAGPGAMFPAEEQLASMTLLARGVMAPHVAAASPTLSFGLHAAHLDTGLTNVTFRHVLIQSLAPYVTLGPPMSGGYG